MSNEYFAGLTYNDVSRGTRLCAAVGPVEIELYRIFGMVASLAIAYAMHPCESSDRAERIPGAEESMVERRLRKLLRRRPRRYGEFAASRS